jgi:hypothetical protein
MDHLSLSELLARISSVAVIVAGAGSAAAASWKFVAWLRDRQLNARIESAVALKTNGVTPALKDFADRELSRLHFLRLTGLDRREGHDALLACHQLLGGTDGAWAKMRAAGGFLQTVGGSAHVQALDGRAWAGIAFAYTAGAVFAVAACALFAFAVMNGLAVPDSALSVSRVYAATMATIFAGTFAMFAIACLRYATFLLDARTLGQRIKRAEAKSRGEAP